MNYSDYKKLIQRWFRETEKRDDGYPPIYGTGHLDDLRYVELDKINRCLGSLSGIPSLKVDINGIYQ